MSTITTTNTAFDAAVERVRAGVPLDEAVENLLTELTPEEKLDLLDGDVPFWEGMADMLANGYNRVPLVMGQIERVGVPGLRFSDGPRGVVMGQSTAFPVSMARGATWDVQLEERIGTAIGLEMRAQGANFFGGVCINLPRHPAWGRVQETYGEDPVLLGEFGAALTRGIQRNAMAVAKHYALNSMENARFTVNVTADDAALHEAYLAHFRRVVDEGVDGIMTSYNAVNGEWAGQNEELLDAVLRGEWGFDGVTVTDFVWGLRDAAKSLRAGLDVEEPFRQQRGQHLPDDLRDGRASWEDVDRAARRILRTQLRFVIRRDREEPSMDVVFSTEHRTLSREAATKAIVLLKNDAVDDSPLLPFRKQGLRRVALLGRLADTANTGDHGSSDVRSPEVVSPAAGIRAAVPDADVRLITEEDPLVAAAVAADSDVAIVVVGYTAQDEGEYTGSSAFADPELVATFPPVDDSPVGRALIAQLEHAADGSDVSIIGSASDGGDRPSLRLRDADVELIRAVAARNPRTVVVIVTAGAVITEEWRDAVPAVLIGWYAGSEGGSALADVLFGDADATGRLPFSIPTSEAHLPFFDRDATSITYDKWFGQRLLDRDKHAAAFPLGFGLSYTSFELADATVTDVEEERFEVIATVKNTGDRAGRHVVQIYARPTGAEQDFPSRVLVGFAPIHLAAGEEGTVTVPSSTRPLLRRVDGAFVPAAPTAVIEVADYAGAPGALHLSLSLS